MKKCPSCGKSHSLDGDSCEGCQKHQETILLNHDNHHSETAHFLDPAQHDTVILLDTNETDPSDRDHHRTVTEQITNPSNEETVLLSSEQLSSNQQIESQVEQSDILFNRYQVLEILGKGGMGTVYLAEDLRLQRKLWAIKEIHMSPDSYQDFVDEAKMLVTLEHSNLPKIVDYIPPNDKGQTYLVMDYIKGKTLSEIFEEAGYSLPYLRIVKYAIQICNLLDYLHNHKPEPIIYRDLKPSNVMIDENDNVQLIDFGIARNYKEGKQTDTVPMGTVGFASPEQFNNLQTDNRTDLFSLGAMIYYLLSGGRFVYASQEPLAAINQKVPKELSEIVQKLVKTDPKGRYQSAKALKHDLIKLRVTKKLNTEPLPIEEPIKKTNLKEKKKEEKKKERKEKAVRFRRSLKRWTISLAILILLGVASFGGYKYMALQHDQAHTIDKFEKAIIQKDKAELKDLLISSDERLEIGDQELESFLSYMASNPFELSRLITSLEKQATEESENSVSASENNENGPIFQIEKGMKIYYLIDTFKIQVTPLYLTISANKEDTKFFLNDKEVANSDSSKFSQDIGPLMPGLYRVKGIWKADYITMEDEQSIELIGAGEKPEEVQFDFDGSTISIKSNVPKASLFVNGEDTGLTVEQADSFGPVLTNGSMKVHAEYTFPWGVVRSEETHITDGRLIELTLDPLTEELQQTLMNIGNEYFQSYAAAYQSNDAAKLKHINSAVLSTHSAVIQNQINLNTTWQGTLLSTNYDLESFDLYENAFEEIEVVANASAQFAVAPAATVEEFNQTLTFIFNQELNSWEITHLNQITSISSSHMKEFAFNEAGAQ